MVSTAIYDIAGGDPVLMQTLLAEFRVSLMKSLDLLRAAETDEEWRERAHRLKGGALAIGAERLAAASARVEAGEISGPDALPEIEAAFNEELPEDTQ